MKKLIVIALTTVMCVGAFAQGRISLVNNNNYLVYLSTDTTKLKAADQASAGTATPVSGTLLSGATLVAGLYIGTSSTAMSLVTTTIVGPGVGPGRIINAPYQSPTIPSGTIVFAQVAVWDNSFATVDAAQASAGYFGRSSLFTFNMAASPTAITVAANSTWAAGTQPVAPGFGAIEMTASVPEPSTLALAGLGALALTVIRRRK